MITDAKQDLEADQAAKARARAANDFLRASGGIMRTLSGRTIYLKHSAWPVPVINSDTLFIPESWDLADTVCRNRVRRLADTFAAWAKFHDDEVPVPPEKPNAIKNILQLLEEARCQALLVLDTEGMHSNLWNALRKNSFDDIEESGQLPAAVYLEALSRFSGELLPDRAAHFMGSFKSQASYLIDETAWQNMEAALEDAEEFAAVLADLPLQNKFEPSAFTAQAADYREPVQMRLPFGFVPRAMADHFLIFNTRNPIKDPFEGLDEKLRKRFSRPITFKPIASIIPQRATRASKLAKSFLKAARRALGMQEERPEIEIASFADRSPPGIGKTSIDTADIIEEALSKIRLETKDIPRDDRIGKALVREKRLPRELSLPKPKPLPMDAMDDHGPIFTDEIDRVPGPRVKAMRDLMEKMVSVPDRALPSVLFRGHGPLVSMKCDFTAIASEQLVFKENPVEEPENNPQPRLF